MHVSFCVQPALPLTTVHRPEPKRPTAPDSNSGRTLPTFAKNVAMMMGLLAVMELVVSIT